MTMRLDISVGPVQGFVAQSRRTRDLWGSSYLLSFLSAHAMRGAHEAGGRIVQPVVAEDPKDPLFLWVMGHREGSAPQIGSVPNHFGIEVDGDVPSVARAGVRALDAAWKQVCDAVWERFVGHACAAGNETAHIWRRQIRAFWEVTWTAGPSGDQGGLLARRKHWRSHRPLDEPGDKCTVMHDLQELSGYVRGESRASRTMQDRFWKGVHDHEHLGPLDLRDNERLCAIALVKRLFPKVALKALGWDVDVSHWPSTVYVGAVPWTRRVAYVAPQPAREYAEAVRQSATGVLAERRPPFAGLDKATAGDFPMLDANYFHRDFVKNEGLCPLPDGAGGASGARAALDRLLKTVYDARNEDGRPLGPPSSFYALLLADGDRLGKLVGTLGGSCAGRALSLFTREVPDIVSKHDGVAVYAGGDDVLAMLPVPRALACASSLSDRYMSAFADVGAAQAEATLSAAVVFAHVRLPLGVVIAEAHRLLDDIAKEANGRSSLAVGVMKRGGRHCQWVTTWMRRDPDGGSPCAATGLLESLTERLERNATDPGLSSALLYRIRETITRLHDRPQWEPGAWSVLPTGLDVRALLRAEILRSLAGSSIEEAEAHAGELADLAWKLLGPARASRGTVDDVQAGVDALLLARFLANPGHEDAD